MLDILPVAATLVVRRQLDIRMFRRDTMPRQMPCCPPRDAINESRRVERALCRAMMRRAEGKDI